jgi:hypothetical protein
MKYGTTLIVLGIVNVLVLYSGLPTGWKKGIIIVTSVCLILLGWMLRTIAKRRAQKIHTKVTEIEHAAAEELAQITQEITHDVSHQVEEEIDRL